MSRPILHSDYFCFLSGVSGRDLGYTISSPESDFGRSGSLTSTSGSPYFTSRPNTYKEKVRESVTLNCDVENLGKRNYSALKRYIYVYVGSDKFGVILEELYSKQKVVGDFSLSIYHTIILIGQKQKTHLLSNLCFCSAF